MIIGGFPTNSGVAINQLLRGDAHPTISAQTWWFNKCATSRHCASAACPSHASHEDVGRGPILSPASIVPARITCWLTQLLDDGWYLLIFQLNENQTKLWEITGWWWMMQLMMWVWLWQADWWFVEYFINKNQQLNRETRRNFKAVNHRSSHRGVGSPCRGDGWATGGPWWHDDDNQWWKMMVHDGEWHAYRWLMMFNQWCNLLHQ